MKISYIFGVVAKHDAVSNAICDEIAMLRNHGIEDVRLYAHVCEHDTLPFTRVATVSDIALDAHFQRSNLVVFHSGVYYSLFDLLFAVPKKAKRLVVFHNTTPKEFVAPRYHHLIDRSFAQWTNMLWADHVICVSETNLSALRSCGINVSASVLPIAVPMDAKFPSAKPSFSGNVVRLLFVGRFVHSKGPKDFLAALEKTLPSQLPLQVDMVGKIAYSNPQVLQEIERDSRRLEQDYRGQLEIRIRGDIPEETKRRLLRDADLFVLPTYHEGFCVPIVEALAAGSKVIAYENSNTPAISGGLATLTPTGDVAQLALAIQRAIGEIRSPEWRGAGVDSYLAYASCARAFVQQFSSEAVAERFVKTITDVAQPASPLRHANEVKAHRRGA